MISCRHAAETITGERRHQRHVGKIARWIAGSEHVVAFTGAGISTDSRNPRLSRPRGGVDAARR